MTISADLCPAPEPGDENMKIVHCSASTAAKRIKFTLVGFCDSDVVEGQSTVFDQPGVMEPYLEAEFVAWVETFFPGRFTVERCSAEDAS